MKLVSYKNRYKTSRFFDNAVVSFKNRISCFTLFSTRIVEGHVYSLKNSPLIDIGFKYLIPYEKSSIKHTINLKVIRLESILNNIHPDFVRFKNDLVLNSNWSFIEKAFTSGCILKGRILNPIYNGFCVGIWGFVGFLPIKHSITNKCNTRSVFIILDIDYFKNTLILSQSKIDKSSLRILLRLSSQLSYISRY